MSLHYTPPPAQASGSDLWQFVGGVSPDDIDLNTGAGVNGILAVNPFNAKLFQVLTQIGGIDFAGHSATDGQKSWLNVLQDSAGTLSLLQEFLNNATNLDLFREITETKLAETATDGTAIAFRETTLTQLDNIVDDGVNEKAQFTQQKDLNFLKIFVGGVEVAQIKHTAQGVEFQTNSITQFNVKFDGKLATNQKAATAHATPAGQLRFEDIAGNAFFVDCFTP